MSATKSVPTAWLAENGLDPKKHWRYWKLMIPVGSVWEGRGGAMYVAFMEPDTVRFWRVVLYESSAGYFHDPDGKHPVTLDSSFEATEVWPHLVLLPVSPEEVEQRYNGQPEAWMMRRA